MLIDQHLTAPGMNRRKIQLMFGNGGGGHKASANAVQKILATSPASSLLDVSLVDASAISGAGPGDWLYNVLLSYNAVSAIEVLHTTLHSIILPISLPTLRRAFRLHFAQTPDIDAVVSFIPILNSVFAETMPSHTQLFTVLTDFSHTDSHPWIQHPRQHVIAGTDVAVAQALSMGYALPGTPSPGMRLTATSGMVVHPRFYKFLSESTCHRKRRELGFPPDLPVVLILFGANAPTDPVIRLVNLFLERPAATSMNVIVICGKNKGLYNRLSRRKVSSRERRLFITGFTNQIPLFMQLADVLVGKPGPGVVSEAFVSRLPCILLTGASEAQVMKQEKDVLDWVRREGIGVVARSTAEAASITSGQITELRARLMSKSPNRAVFEVRDTILRGLRLPIPDPLNDPRPEQPEHSTDNELASDSSGSGNPSPFRTFESPPQRPSSSSNPTGASPELPREIDIGDLDVRLTPSRSPLHSKDPVSGMQLCDNNSMESAT